MQQTRLIVGLNSDASVRRLKGPDRPVQTGETRAVILGKIEHVNLVVIFGENTPIGLIERLLPELLVKGFDHKPDEIVGHDVVTAAGGRVLTVEVVSNQSTTGMIGQSRAARCA
jgi:D-beta-D-heptose 7-phosphate kinase/D-beta-D-heptose 1-phosphate adenosyltransferase